MSSGSTGGSGLEAGAGEGGTLRYLTCSTRRAARTPLRRRMLTGQRRPELSSSPAAPPPSLPPPPSLILRIQAFTTMHYAALFTADTSTGHRDATSDAGGRRLSQKRRRWRESLSQKRRSRLRAAIDWDGALTSAHGERTLRRRAGPHRWGDITPYQLHLKRLYTPRRPRPPAHLTRHTHLTLSDKMILIGDDQQEVKA